VYSVHKVYNSLEFSYACLSMEKTQAHVPLNSDRDLFVPCMSITLLILDVRVTYHLAESKIHTVSFMGDFQ
jgi:hypothetical protein